MLPMELHSGSHTAELRCGWASLQGVDREVGVGPGMRHSAKSFQGQTGSGCQLLGSPAFLYACYCCSGAEHGARILIFFCGLDHLGRHLY